MSTGMPPITRTETPERRRSVMAAALASPSFLIGLCLSSVFVLAAMLSLLWTPYDVTVLDIASRLQAPSPTHWFGTDAFGRDILSMIMVGARASTAVALIAVGIGIGIGVPLGLAAATVRGSLARRNHHARQ